MAKITTHCLQDRNHSPTAWGYFSENQHVWQDQNLKWNWELRGSEGDVTLMKYEQIASSSTKQKFKYIPTYP
jgi:hypothetical protein